MKPNTLKRIDNTIGRMMLVLLRPVVFCIDKFCSRRVFPDQPKKISFLKILGGGSLLIAYPAILSIRKQFPQARLILVCAKEVAVYAELTDLFDEIVPINTGSISAIAQSSLRAIKACFASDFFVNYELHSKLSAIFAALTCSTERFGLYQDWNRWQERYINHPVFYNSATPIYVGYEQIARKTGATPVEWSAACRHFQSHLGFQRAASASASDKSTLIGVAAFCSALYKERQFSNEEFAQILDRHSPESGAEVMILGGRADLEPATALAGVIESKLPLLSVKNMAGKTSLRDVVHLFERFTFLLSIDSGLNHIARLLQIPTITYWGPSDPQSRLKEINPAYESVFYQKISCAPCVHLIDLPPCAGNNVCMKQFVQPRLAEISNDGWEI